MSRFHLDPSARKKRARRFKIRGFVRTSHDVNLRQGRPVEKAANKGKHSLELGFGQRKAWLRKGYLLTHFAISGQHLSSSHLQVGCDFCATRAKRSEPDCPNCVAKPTKLRL